MRRRIVPEAPSCVSVTRWRKSSRSNPSGNCVELTFIFAGIRRLGAVQQAEDPQDTPNMGPGVPASVVRVAGRSRTCGDAECASLSPDRRSP
jgi:hypothetical protein